MLLRPAPGVTPPEDLAAEVRSFLRQRGVRPLSDPLQRLLADPTAIAVPTQPHALVGKLAPDFDLEDPSGQRYSLRSFVERGPVVLVFYYGYYCNHCVGQLFALEKDLPYFHEIGAQVVALSPDPPALTRQRFRSYGKFHFPVLSDSGNSVAEKYGVYQRAHSGRGENLDHATFVIDRDGTIQWAQQGDEPFTDDRALLLEVAHVSGRVPAAKK
jgi:peroxiredoxin